MNERIVAVQPGEKGSPPSDPPILRRSLYSYISEEDFKAPLRENAQSFFRLAAVITLDKKGFSNRFYFNLMNEAKTLESFLDDHGAKENLEWHYFRELIASIRNFAIAAFNLSHVLDRYHDYAPAEPAHSAEEFLTHGEEAVYHFNGIVKVLMTEALEELRRKGCALSITPAAAAEFKEIRRITKLPSTLETERYNTTEQVILRIVESYRKAALKVSRERYGAKRSPKEMADLIPARLNETKIKILETTLHNIQSEYDTHIRKTLAEADDPDLVGLRAFISMPMHLFETAQWLIHFYERHENEIHSDSSRERISLIVDKDLVLRLLSNFALFYAHRYMMAGKTVVEKVMTRLSRVERAAVPIPKPAGFHARPAYYVTLVVEEHGTDAFLRVGERKFDARSVLDILEAGGLAADLNIDTVEFEADERTLADLKTLAASNYCENEQIPKDLAYIRIARNIMP